MNIELKSSGLVSHSVNQCVWPLRQSKFILLGWLNYEREEIRQKWNLDKHTFSWRLKTVNKTTKRETSICILIPLRWFLYLISFSRMTNFISCFSKTQTSGILKSFHWLNTEMVLLAKFSQSLSVYIYFWYYFPSTSWGYFSDVFFFLYFTFTNTNFQHVHLGYFFYKSDKNQAALQMINLAFSQYRSKKIRICTSFYLK